jgi:site-specific DNA-methyltransferase (adenine-specific)
VTPYYADDSVTLHHGDCREITEWLAADVLVTDPPYGRGWRQGRLKPPHQANDAHVGIVGDAGTETRDGVLAAWGGRPAVIFGDLMLAPPGGTVLVGIYRKPPNAGTRGAMGGYRRDAEAWYLIGPWATGLGGRSSIVATGARSQGLQPQGRYAHPHAKPVDVMETLISACPPGVIADPFAGSGSTLVAARNLGRRAIGVELDERYCELAARRLAQDVLNLHPGGAHVAPHLDPPPPGETPDSAGWRAATTKGTP